jgi:hypothetical protein
MEDDLYFLQVAKEKMADLQRDAAEAHLATLVAGSDAAEPLATLFLVAIAGVLLWLMF